MAKRFDGWARGATLVAVIVATAGCPSTPAPTEMDVGGSDAGRSDGGGGTDGGLGPDGGGVDGGGIDGGGGEVDAPSPPPADANLDANGSGPIVDVRCEDLGADFPGFVDFPGSSPQLNLTVCLDASGCHVTNDFRRRDPIQPYQCAVEDQMFRISYDGFADQWIAAPAGDFTTRWSTTGVARTWPRTTPAATELSSIVERPDGVRYRIDYRIDAASIHVSAVELVDPPVPAWGATDDCERMPQTYGGSVSLYGRDVYARVCIEIPPYPSCNVAADIESSPEDESCVAPFALAVDPSTGGAFAMVNFPYGSEPGGPTLESASAGTIDGGSGMVTDVPPDTSITFVVSDYRAATGETYRHSIVARWTGSAWVVESVTEL